MHGGGPKVVAGRPLPQEYKEPNLGLVEKGVVNLLHHLNNVKKSGAKPVVCINYFHTDSEEEIKLVRKLVEETNIRCALSKHWLKGGEGALELTDAVIDACNEKVDFKFLYPVEMPLRERVKLIAKEIYGADGVSWTPEAEAKAKKAESNPEMKNYATMMVKTHLSLSHDPTLKGAPKGWILPVRDLLIFAGAKFLCPCAGTISLMPGTSSDPAFRRVDVDVNTGKVTGLF